MMISPPGTLGRASPTAILDHALDRSTQRSSTECRVIPLVGEMILGGIGEFEAHALATQLCCGAADHQINDLTNLGLAELVEDDGVVDAVQELRTEVSLQCVVDLLLHLRVVDRLSPVPKPIDALRRSGAQVQAAISTVLRKSTERPGR